MTITDMMAVNRENFKKWMEKGAVFDNIIRELALLMPDAELALKMMEVSPENDKRGLALLALKMMEVSPENDKRGLALSALKMMGVNRESVKKWIEEGAVFDNIIRQLNLHTYQAKSSLDMMAVNRESIKEWLKENKSFRWIKHEIDIYSDEAKFELEMRMLQHRHIPTLIDAGVSSKEIRDTLDIRNDEAVLQLEIMVVNHPRTQARIDAGASYKEIRHELGIYDEEAKSLLQMKVAETTYYDQSWLDNMDCSFSWSGQRRNRRLAFIYDMYKSCGPNNKTKFTGHGTRKEFDEAVDKWEKSAPKNEDRSEAARRMKASARENSSWLVLAGLPITSLPDISFLRLTDLYLSDTNLATISEKYLPKTLEYIGFDNTPIEQIPDTFFSALPSLNKLEAKNCRLKNFPKNMKNSLKNKAISIELQGNPLSIQAFEIYKECNTSPDHKKLKILVDINYQYNNRLVA